MKVKNILFPFDINNDNKRAFSFTMELAKLYDANIIALTTNNVNKEKNVQSINKPDYNYSYLEDPAHLHILELKGYYFSFFNKWKKINKPKFEIIIKKDNLEKAIVTILKERDIFVLVLHNNLFNTNFSNHYLFGLSKQKNVILSLPIDTAFYKTNIDLNDVEFENQKVYIFNEMISKMKIFNLPGDINLLKESVLLSEQV